MHDIAYHSAVKGFQEQADPTCGDETITYDKIRLLAGVFVPNSGLKYMDELTQGREPG